MEANTSQLIAINLLCGTTEGKKKCERLLIGLKHLSEIKGGSTTVLSYQALMVASPSSYKNLNEWPSSDVERAEDVKNKVLI